MNNLGMILSMKIFIGLAILNLIVSLLLRESPRMQSGRKQNI
jgi:hypothetical protein